MSLRALFSLIAVAAALIFSGSAPAAEPVKAGGFTLPDYNGTPHSLSEYNNAKAIVVMFIATQCPVSNGYNGRMEALYADYKDKGVVILGINSNKSETIDEIKSHAKEHGLEFTILKDTGNVVADRFGASVTPETYILSPSHEILYHGRIDDSRRESEVSSRDLRTALDEVLAGKTVSVKETRAFGCTIKKVD